MTDIGTSHSDWWLIKDTLCSRIKDTLLWLTGKEVKDILLWLTKEVKDILLWLTKDTETVITNWWKTHSRDQAYLGAVGSKFVTFQLSYTVRLITHAKIWASPVKPSIFLRWKTIFKPAPTLLLPRSSSQSQRTEQSRTQTLTNESLFTNTSIQQTQKL